MTILQYMNQIEELIASKRPSETTAYSVFRVDGEVHIGLVISSERRDTVLISLTPSDINNGPANWQWYAIAQRLMTLLQEGLLK